MSSIEGGSDIDVESLDVPKGKLHVFIE